MTLSFGLCRFDFDVLTFYFCILCIILHILNGVNSRGRAKMEK